ncbi:hypothetical protein CMV_011500 [Castanea mollissima]|uniref:NB-ARC domain-containing protein n=1 Tax=Castanea mollissima TaxID=60419 RepID=A0A8J4VP40_9ROSI|nr:hypothetical protein CMV_011500 [Castanea mollissima]
MSVTMLPSGKDEIEIAPTDGQLLLEVSTYSNRSIERTLLRILRCMNDVTARRIGFHGSGGIGKTGVLKALISNPKIKDLFDVIFWVTVSRNWSTRKVQDEVLRQLSLSSEDFETDFEIAERLLQVLKSQRFLLILDDVWEPIDLNVVGIPDPASKKGSRMILSTRFPDEQLGGIIESPNIQQFARAIVQKCHGFPLLIIVTGRALAKENDALAWMHASKEFSQCSAHGIYGYEALIQKLKFSYNRLEGPDVKICFLYCALFPEDQEISIDELVYYCIQEGLVAGNRPDSYKRGRGIADILVAASLLQSVQAGLSIKMHHLIRDLASRILSLEVEGCQFLCGSYSKMTQLSHMGNRLPILEYHRFLSRAGAGLIELPLKEEWEEAKMIFFMDNELTSLPERPNCPRLLALFLQRNHNLRVIPTSFFDLMPSLTILNLSKTRIKFLPKSICKLTILEVLILRDCERMVQLPSEVGSLRRLVVLDLQGTKLNTLSNEISELASLRHLKVSFYGSVNQMEYVNLPRELLSHVVIGNLSELETLSIDVYPGDMRWNKIVESVIDEVSNLTNLTTFCCYFPEVKFLERFLRKCATWKIGGLTESKFVVGHDVKRFVSQNVDNLELDYVQWGQCLSLSEFGLINFNGLRLCVVRECPEIQEIIADAELSDSVFLILEHLTINSLPDLRKICKEMMPRGSFAKLRVLTLYTCPNLEFVFASSMVQCFSNFEELIVEDCSAIKKIVDSDSGILPSLKRLKLHYLPNFVNIMKGAWPPLENISFYDCPMLKKLGIDSNLIQTIKEIKAIKIGGKN